uniref:major histocompatibility complex Y, class I heavy chain 8 precursor n=1 Tax=Gallus gallus TaxID=9031 RepID=UPI0002C88114|nr:major histocompatibility complex Y, class I heavy chain 8 precursor [Gallus gallus]QSE03650.1 major histocompatibility complex y class I heavy chain [Gallus gallus]QSE03661.1 major histocompatibility complex y class I heavy chain [Gallus gallus]QSE03684.1 major histocompatibility complex y class I heavy chain [Gallus gallus]QSE03726.1 major histocompatibility complex y class I heavy chain [Gallus gallus]QSE03737.1 major histocompatibility complex y class I heavy chain [Gallus gallus]|eukprot:XP_025011666.1 class I histocompatibility antigen, F10 alpha chain-like isoform X2 [Gallus gallus]
MGPSKVVVLGLLLGALGAEACWPHSLRYFVTGMTDPGPGMPRFVIVGYVDGDLFGKYDSKIKSAQPIVEMLPQEDQEHWAVQTQKARGGERDFDWFLSRLPERYNKSGGSHTLQRMIGCDILADGSIRGHDKYAFDGRDYIAFDMDTMTFTAADPVAEITKRRWETEGTYAERWKHELGTVCVQNLRRYLEHGKAALKRRERPEVRVWGKEANGNLTLSCHAHGFYPRPIAISWMKDGMVGDQETHCGGVVPNSDGTYHASAVINVLPKDGDKYWCRVEHASLPQPSLFLWEPQPNLIPIVAGAVVAIVAVIAVVVGLVVWKSKSGKEKKGYEAAPGHDGESSISATGSEPSI